MISVFLDGYNNMPTKEEVLQYIKSAVAEQVITKDEVVMAFGQVSNVDIDQVTIKKLGIAEILYYIGGAVVFLGISILIYQNWSMLSFSTKVLATLGGGIAAYVVGVLFTRNVKTETVGSAFYLISALIMPLGLYIVFDHAGFDINGYVLQSLVSVILFGTYLVSYIVFRKNVFTLFSIIFATWFFFSITSYFIGGGYHYVDYWKLYQYRILVVGVSYLLLGHSFSKNERAPLSGILYGFGILGFLGSALFLGGWKPYQSIFWELIYPLLVFGALFASIHVKSKAFLTWGTIFLMLYILKITAEYFSSGLGWPLALVIAGLGMIGVGYLSILLKNKYLSA